MLTKKWSSTKWSKSDIFDLIQTITSFGSFGIIIVIIIGITTFRISRNQQRFEIVEKFSEEWNSPKFGKIQKEFANKEITADSLRGNKVILCNFFDRLGMYESEKIIKIEDVYKMFGNWPCRYWNLLKDAIYEYRRMHNHPKSWANFENLCKAIEKFEKKSRNKEGK